MTFSVRRAVAVVAVLSLAVGLSAQTTVPKELAALQGTWIMDSVNGQSLAAHGVHGQVVFTGNKYVVTIDGAVDERGTVKIDLSKKPAWIDFMIEQGQGDTSGMVQLGLLEVGTDRMKLQLASPGATLRPATFERMLELVVMVLSKKK